MRKLKVYLDTSVISHLLQDDVPEKMADTRQLWEMFKDGKYDVYLSTVTLREIQKCSEPKKTQLIDCLNEIQFTTLDITDDVVVVEFGNNKNCRIPMKKDNIVEIDKQSSES